MPTPTVIKQYQYSDTINRRYWDGKYVFDDFTVDPIVSSAAGLGAPTGTAGNTNALLTGKSAFRWNVIGTQTILAPTLDPNGFGLNLVQDAAVAGDGLELTVGDPLYSPMSFVIGTDAAFFIQATFKVQDASGTNPLIIGFRKAAAYNATLANYTDFASIGIVGTSNPNKIVAQTQIATGGVVATDSTQTIADATAFQVKVMVSATGVVTYQYNYAAPTVVAAYTFANGLTVVPFIRFTQAADLTTYASSNYLEIGYQS